MSEESPYYENMPESYKTDSRRRKRYGEAREVRIAENYIPDEVWIPIPGYRNYEVSNLGRVKNGYYERLLKPQVTSYGHETVGIVSDHGIPATKIVHRLVGYLFCDDYDDQLHVRYIDNNKRNNSATNLQWVRPKYRPA